MYSSVLSGSAAVERVWTGDSVVDPTIGHRSDPVLGPDLVFTVVDGSCAVALQGPVTTRTVYPFRAGAHYIGVRFRPGVGSVRDDVSLTEIRDDAAPVRRLAGVDLGRLADRLVTAPDLEARGRLVREAIDGSALSTSCPSGLVVAAIERLRHGSCDLPIARLAADLGVTERTLQRRFRDHLGINPKHAARLVRIERLTEALDRESSVSQRPLAALALSSGYADQSHMTNEVGRVLGVTPKALVAERVGQPASM